MDWQWAQAGHLQITVTSDPSTSTVLQACPDLVTWNGVLTNAPGSGPVVFTESCGDQETRKFFRLVRGVVVSP